MATNPVTISNPIFIMASAYTEPDEDITPSQAARIMQSAHEYLYASRRVNQHFHGTRVDYASHNMAHTLLFFARLEAEKLITILVQ